MENFGFVDGMLVGAERSRAAFARGDKTMVFDWDKAATLIREHGATEAEAGLQSDWGCTGGSILEDGEPDMDSYTYLSSLWATPQIKINGEYYDCYTQENPHGWNSSTKWPQSAVDILKA